MKIIQHQFGEDTDKLLDNQTIVHPGRLFMGDTTRSMSPKTGILIKDSTNRIIAAGQPRPSFSRKLSMAEYRKILESQA